MGRFLVVLLVLWMIPVVAVWLLRGRREPWLVEVRKFAWMLILATSLAIVILVVAVETDVLNLP